MQSEPARRFWCTNVAEIKEFETCLFKFDKITPDGRMITKDSFKNYDGQVVPLVSEYNSNPRTIIGSAILEATDDGIMAKCTLDRIVDHAFDPSGFRVVAYADSITQGVVGGARTILSAEIKAVTYHKK